MATSGSTDFTVTRNDIVKSALQKVGKVREGGTPTATQYTEGSLALNILVKAYHGLGMPLWAMKTGYILPQTGVNDIDVGPTGDHVTNSYVQTALASAAVSGAGSIVVDSATGISASDNIGIELDNGDVQWTTVNGAPSGTTITLTATLTEAAAADNTVYTYTTKTSRPLRITHAYIKNVDNSEYQIAVIGRNDYFALGDKTVESVPSQIYYDHQLTDGVISIWPRFEDGDNVIRFTYHRPFEDFDASTDNPDFPQAWIRPLVWGLTYELAPEAGLQLAERQQLYQEVYGKNGILELALDSDTEYLSLYFQPNIDAAP